MSSDERGNMPMKGYKLNKVKKEQKKVTLKEGVVLLNSVQFTSVCSKQWGAHLPGLLHGRRVDAVALVLVRTDGQILARADALRIFRTFARVLHEAFDLSGERFVDRPAAHRVARANLCLVLVR